ncbi:MAG: hypothetical protein ACI8UQ_001094 [Bacteroidia bacterium]|jgi:hypothetical protein
MQHKWNCKYLYTVQRTMKFLLILVFLVLSLSSFAQQANHWVFGKNVHLEFRKDSVIQNRITDVDWLEGSTVYSDIQGNLIYYKAASEIRDSSNKVVSPQVGGGHDATQGSLLLKHLEASPYYFLASGRSGGCGFSTIVSDSIDIYISKFPFLGGEKQQAINHQNGRDIWYANHAQNGDSIYFFLIQKQGLLECPVVTHTKNEYTGGEFGTSTQGQMKFSPNGKYLAEVSFVRPFSVGLYTFNTEYPSTDSVYLYQKGYTTDYSKRWGYGLEFSPDASQLYVSAGRANDLQEPNHPPVLYQLSIDSLKHDINGSSWFSLDSLWGVEDGALQLAPDGKIYYALPNKTYLGVINNPNDLGTASNYVREGLTLDSGGICRFGLPTFNQSYFYTPQIDYRYEEDCQTNEYQFWGADTFGATNFEWRFRDVRNSTVDVKSGKNISYTFSQADSLENKYEVTFVASNGTKTDSITKTLTIRPKLIKDFLGRDTFYCVSFDSAQGDTTPIDFKLTLHTPPNLHCIHWGVNDITLEPYSNARGDTVIGYENFYGHITANQSLTIDTAGVYTARITNKAFCRAYDTIVVREYARPSKSVISRNGRELESSIVAAEYRWYFNGSLKNTTTDSKLTPDSNGYWQVQLISEYGCESELSDSFNVGFAGIDKRYETLDLRFEIYPNPSDGNITIAVPKGGDYQVLIYDMTGKLIYNTSQSLSLLFELELELVSGTYLLTLTDEDGKTGSKQIMIR